MTLSELIAIVGSVITAAFLSAWFLSAKLTSLSDKISGLSARLTDHQETSNRKSEDHEQRIRTLERADA